MWHLRDNPPPIWDKRVPRHVAAALCGASRSADTCSSYRFDIGGHRCFTKYAPVQALWEEILRAEFLEMPPRPHILYQGRCFDSPLETKNALAGLGLWNTTRILLSFLQAQLRPNPEEESFEQWASNRFGQRLYEIFFKTYTEKVGGTLHGDPRRVGGASASRGSHWGGRSSRPAR